MTTAATAPCLSELGGLPGRNASLISGARTCNRSAVRPPTYTPTATAAFAIAITFMMMVTIVGNILVIIAVLTSRSLRGAQNLFLVSLAAADILVATLIIPFSLANELQGYWAFSSVWCEIYLALDVLFCTSSIAHLCAIALDRYLSISRPVAYGAKRTPSRIKAAIIVVWLISAVISFPPLLTLDKSDGGEEVCELNNERWYILYSTIGSFFAPCVIMILVYIRIYQIAKRHTRCPAGHKQKAAGGGGGGGSMAIGEPAEHPLQNGRHLPKAGQDRPSEAISAPVPTTTSSAKSRRAGGPEQFAVLQPKRSDEGEEAAKDKPQDSDAELETGKSGDKEDAKSDGSSQSGDAKGQVVNMGCRSKNTEATSSGTKLAPDGAPRLQGTSLSRRKAAANRERRFTFVLAVVMGVFVICWFPFFLSYSLQAVCPESCRIPNPLFKFFFWIGYCNSCLNPVIYTIFNKDFRKAFKRILCRSTKATFF